MRENTHQENGFLIGRIKCQCGDVFARFASTLDPGKATLVASIMMVYYKTFHTDGPTESSDWLYNTVSPSYTWSLQVWKH